MKSMFKFLFLSVFSALSFCAWAAGLSSEAKNHEFTEIQLGYPAGESCSFQYAPIYFCDERHLAEIKYAIEKKRPNFNHHYILIAIAERKQYFEHSVVAIDSRTGVAYPLPFDSYSGDVDAKGNVHDYGHISYALNGGRVCINGAIVAHRQIDSGKLCWDFDGNKFVGHHTPYMD